MSKMLEQAIIDAEALKEAALKNAEAAIVEKYSYEVKEVVDKLLEQPEDELGGGLEPAPAPVADEFGDMPRADVEGEDLCPCPDEEEEVERRRKRKEGVPLTSLPFFLQRKLKLQLSSAPV